MNDLDKFFSLCGDFINALLIGVLGGVVRLLNDDKAHKLRKILAGLTASVFSSIIVWLILGIWNTDCRVKMAISGLAGFLSVRLLAALDKVAADNAERIMKEKLNLKDENDSSNSK